MEPKVVHRLGRKYYQYTDGGEVNPQNILHSIEANLYLQDWTHPETTGIGAGIDSFYEYALKWYILSGM